MADISNRQLAEIISQTAEKINSNVLKERKIANELEKTISKFESVTATIQKEMEEVRRTPIKLDLSGLNSFYEEKTAENIKRVNSRLKVPNLSVYILIGSFLLFLCSALFFWQSMKSKQDIISDYLTEQEKDGYVLVRKIDKEDFESLLIWFKENPNKLKAYQEWEKKKTKK